MVRPFRMEVPPNEVFEMSRSSYLIIGYLLRDDHKEFGVQISLLVG